MALPALFQADRSDRGRVRLTGRDRQTFLQGMVTNEVASLAPGDGCYAFQLDATGHVLADLRALCGDGFLLLDVEPGEAEKVAARLDEYLVMERCRIADVSGETGQILLGGTGAPAYLESLGIEGASAWREGQNATVALDGIDILVAATRLLPVPAYDFYFPASKPPSLPGEAVSLASLEPYRIEAGIPRFPVDMDARTLAPETGQAPRAIHYRKGCYIGQEIVARIDARGHTNRTLVGFLPCVVVPSETPVTAEGRPVGRVTSSALAPSSGRPLALGYVRHAFAAPGTVVEIAGQPGTVCALPFAR